VAPTSHPTSGRVRGRPPPLTRGAPLGFMVSMRILRPGSSLSARNETMNSSLNRSEIGRSWSLLSAGSVSQACTVDCHMVFPEMNPRMSGDPSALLEKLIIDAVFRLFLRNGEDSKASNWDSTPASLACRSNVKYHEREKRPRVRGFPSAELVAGMKKTVKLIFSIFCRIHFMCCSLWNVSNRSLDSEVSIFKYAESAVRRLWARRGSGGFGGRNFGIFFGRKFGRKVES
jgi:hypothetical protein